MDNYEREIELIERRYEYGGITRKERDEQILDVERDYRADAEESAQDAYTQELNNW